jgi:hypothetical protein
MFSFLKQTGIEFVYQYSPKWIKPKRYDFYIPLINSIIEVNGEQHYEKSFYTTKKGRTLEEEKENDRVKQTTALKNNIKNYIIIDCRISDRNFIKHNILNSNLINLIDTSIIDWDECERFALSNRIKEACDLWNTNSFYSTKELGNYMNLSSATISKYLKKGSQINLTNYNPKVESEKIINDNATKCRKSVEVYKNGKKLGAYKSCSDVQSNSIKDFGVFLYSSEIGRVCNRRKPSYKGFTFRYTNDSDNMTVYESNNNGKQIEILKDGISLGIYDSCNLLSRVSENEFGVKLLASKMWQVCNGIRKSHQGYTFRYLNENDIK